MKKFKKILKSLKNYKDQLKKITVKDFKNETPKKKQEFKDDNNNNTQLLPYKRIITETLDDVQYKFYQYMSENDSKTDYSNFKKYKRGNNKDYIPSEKTEHTRKKNLFMILMVMLLIFR